MGTGNTMNTVEYIVYFVGTDFNRVKIGVCKGNLHNRIKHIQNGCPDPIKLLGIVLCQNEVEMRTLENELHKRFKEYNTINEWFQLSPEILVYVRDFTESGKDILQKHHNQILESGQKYRARPDIRERRRKIREAYRQRPEVKAHEREYYKEYNRKRREAKRKVSHEQISLF